MADMRGHLIEIQRGSHSHVLEDRDDCPKHKIDSPKRTLIINMDLNHSISAPCWAKTFRCACANCGVTILFELQQLGLSNVSVKFDWMTVFCQEAHDAF